MFRFGFADPSASQHAEPAPAEAEQAQEGPDSKSVGAEEVLQSEMKPAGIQETILISPNLTLFKGVVSNNQAAALLADDRVASNDLIAGVYEGGFKTWEGGVDLAQYVAAALGQQPAALELGAGSRVIELGCGSGLPGLVALWAGAEVHFQDYNSGVLTTLTMQNVSANTSAWDARRPAAAAAAATTAAASAAPLPPQGQQPQPRYFAGSWDALPAALAERGLQHSYDLVLTAETIYSLEAMRSLYSCIKACLRPGSGVALVAAKSYYFGVGGGTATFRRLVEQDGCFDCQAVTVIDDGASNRREILKLSPRQQQQQ